MSAPDPRVPGYLGRILDGDRAVGSCFQVAPGVLVTALHVLDDIEAGREGAIVRVDALADGVAAFSATVARTDGLHDLAVLDTSGQLPESVAGWAATDRIELTVPAVVTGASMLPDEHTYRFLDAPGHWGGGTTRDDEIPWGRFVSSAVVRGMSGAPVRRLSDDFVIGVVSQRYNSADGWGRDSVWVARIEDLRPLLGEMSEIVVTGSPPSHEAVEVVLTVTDDRVRLHGNGIDVSAPHTGACSALLHAIEEIRSERMRLSSSAMSRARLADLTTETRAHSISLRRAGELIADSFLPPPLSTALARVFTAAAATHTPVRIGIDAGQYSELPWEALPDPIARRPLALHPLITTYRHLLAPPARSIPGPLRILIAIAVPDGGRGQVLDYEREVRSVLSAVRDVRHHAAEVRIVEFATTAAIRAEFEQAPAHILHLSGYYRPGHLLLEDELGAARELSAQEFVAEAIPPGSMPPVFSLAARYAGVAAEPAASSFGAALINHGASVVICTVTSVTDRYATALYARVYQALNRSRTPDVVTAVADARRIVHQQWLSSPDPAEVMLTGLDEWSQVTVLAGAGAVRVYDPTVSETVAPHGRVPIPGLLTRAAGEFVGRRREIRRLPAHLAGNRYSGVLLHGIGGVGKTTLAAEIVRCQQFASVIPVVTGETNVDDLLAAVAGTIRQHCLIDEDAARDPRVLRAAQIASCTTEPWQARLTALRTFVFDLLPVLLVLDNFEDNLDNSRSVADPQLAALLSAWLAEPGNSRVFVTSRYPFTFPDNGHHRLFVHQVGPLSQTETLKMVWSLPTLDRLTVTELDRIWRLVGGHPRSLEYLDALLNNQIGRYHDITHRLENAIARDPEARPALTARTLDTALAATVTLIADDILLDELLGRLSPAAHQLLIGASVYREPVENTALLYQVGTDNLAAAQQPDYRALNNTIVATVERHRTEPTAQAFDVVALPPHVLDEIDPVVAEYHTKPKPPISAEVDLGELICELTSSSLLTTDLDTGRAFVHRSTAAALERLCARRRCDDIAVAHRRAAMYWIWRVAAWPQDRDADLHDRLEARYHYLHAHNTAAAHDLTLAICDRLHTAGAWDHEATLIHDTLCRLSATAPERAEWLRRSGMIAQLRGDYVEAERQYRVALTIGEDLGNRVGIATSYRQLGMIAQLRGDYVEAERHYRVALTMDEDLGNRAGVATSDHQLGMIAQLRGDYVEAERYYRRSLATKEELGNRIGTAAAYGQLGLLAQDQGNYTEAEHYYQRALAIKQELGNRAGMATSYGQLGLLAQDRGDYAEAAHRYRLTLAINRELGDHVGIVADYCLLGALAEVQGDFAEAERQYRRALALAEEVGYHAGIAAGHHQLGVLAQLRGDYTAADHEYQCALALAAELGYRAGTATTIAALGSLEFERGELIEAVRLYLEAWRLHTDMKLDIAATQVEEKLWCLRDQLGMNVFRAQTREVLSSKHAELLESLLDAEP